MRQFSFSNPAVTTALVEIGNCSLQGNGLSLVNVEVENYSATQTGLADVPAAGASGLAISAAGPSSFIAFGKAGNVTGTFNTEMLQLNLSGTTALQSPRNSDAICSACSKCQSR